MKALITVTSKGTTPGIAAAHRKVAIIAARIDLRTAMADHASRAVMAQPGFKAVTPGPVVIKTGTAGIFENPAGAAVSSFQKARSRNADASRPREGRNRPGSSRKIE